MICNAEPPGSHPLTFLINGIEPTGQEWSRASKDDKKRFWTIAGTIAEKVKQEELQRGLDRFGHKLRPVRFRKVRFRRSGKIVDGEPLMPHRGLSRTRRLLKFSITSVGVLFYWQSGWAKILDMHRRGACIMRGGRVVGKLPARDVFGISPAGRDKIRRESISMWRRDQMPEPMLNGAMSPRGGLSIELPFDSMPIAPPRPRRAKQVNQPVEEPIKPKAKPIEQWGVTDFLGAGISVMRNMSTSRIKNTATGTPGLKDTRMVITKRVAGFKFAK